MCEALPISSHLMSKLFATFLCCNHFRDFIEFGFLSEPTISSRGSENEHPLDSSFCWNSTLVMGGQINASDPDTLKQATALVSQAIQSEVDGDLVSRDRLLKEACHLDSEFAPARWLQGQVKSMDGSGFLSKSLSLQHNPIDCLPSTSRCDHDSPQVWKGIGKLPNGARRMA